MHHTYRRFVQHLALAVTTSAVFAASASALVFNLRSGGAAAGSPDPVVRQYPLATVCSAGYPTPFTNAEFTAAQSSAPAVVLSFVHPAWGQSLPCDPLAKWIGTDAGASPMSVLYSVDFYVPAPCCIQSASLDFCWMSDDTLGDTINPDGVYVNGVPTGITGGNYATETNTSGVDITSAVHCGLNTLYIHNRDLACAVSGINFSATVKIVECTVPTSATTWSNVKTLYH